VLIGSPLNLSKLWEARLGLLGLLFQDSFICFGHMLGYYTQEHMTGMDIQEKRLHARFSVQVSI
jgi:hypothetical protein